MMNKELGQVRYQTDPSIDVQIGDVVESRVWFLFKWTGQVAYVPGISPKHDKMEVGGIRFVGWKKSGEAIISTPIDPDTNLVLRLRFLRRGTCSYGEIGPEDIVEDESP